MFHAYNDSVKYIDNTLNNVLERLCKWLKHNSLTITLKKIVFRNLSIKGSTFDACMARWK